MWLFKKLWRWLFPEKPHWNKFVDDMQLSPGLIGEALLPEPDKTIKIGHHISHYCSSKEHYIDGVARYLARQKRERAKYIRTEKLELAMTEFVNEVDQYLKEKHA